MKKILLLTTLIAATATGATAQVSVSDVTNDGSTVYDFSNAETVTADPTSGIGYRGQNGGVFNHYGPAAATLTVNGSYDAYNATPGNPGVDNFTGLDNNQASAAEIAGNTAPTFGILNLNNGANPVSLTNTAGANVGASAAFANGITTTIRSNANTGGLRFGAGASYSGTIGAARHVNGYVGKTGNTAFTYPVGDGSQYRPLATTTAPAAATDNLAIAYINGNPSQPLDPTGGTHSRFSLNPAGTAGTTKLVSVSPVGFWDWVPVTGSSPVTFTISIPDLSGTGGYAIPADIRVVGWNTTTNQWDNLSGATGAASNAAGTVLTGSVASMGSYSAIGMGSVGGAPLPIGLLSFGGRAQGCAVVLNWSTATEQGSDYFAIERSADGKGWSEIRRVAAAGKSSATLSYQTTDESPAATQNYYRLRMAEIGGEARYSNVVSVTPDCGHGAQVVIAPNPFSESVTVSGLESGNAVTVWAANGKLVYSAAPQDRAVVISAGNWAAGAYYVRVTAAGGREIAAKQIVKK